MKWLGWIMLLTAGVVLGYLLAGNGGGTHAAPEDWLARVGDQYISSAEFVDEIKRRGGDRSGNFRSEQQRRALLDELLYRRALVARARQAGIADQPEVRRSLDQILVNQVLQRELRPRQEQSDIDATAIEAFYNAHVDDYAIPARRRVAMIFFSAGPAVSAERRAELRQKAEQVRTEALGLATEMRDFGVLARDNSDHQASRYRGGVLGWIGAGDPERYSYPMVVVETANAMSEAGEISDILEDEDGLYLVRLVNYEPRRSRALDELASGIRQRLLRERFIEVEQQFRDETLAQAEIEVREDRLQAIQPTGPAVPNDRSKQPPGLPDAARKETEKP